MTRGKEGISQTFGGVFRILEGGGHFCFVARPLQEAETAAQKTEIEVFSCICGATWLGAKEYEGMLSNAGFVLERKEEFRTEKKLTPSQACEEIEFACTHVPDLYDIATPPSPKYGDDSERG
jgi:hypothetical protein